MNIIMKPIGEIKPYEKNPRHNDDAVQYVAESIRQFGFKVPIVIDSAGVIVAGNTRHKAAKKLGVKEVPCIIADDLTDEQIKAYRLADNKTAEKALWDLDLLTEELGGIWNFDMSAFGFDEIFKEKPPGGYKQTKNLGNLFKTDFAFGSNEWGIPETEAFAEDLTGIEWIPFGEKAKVKDFANTGIHFYIDDYKFESVWTTPDKWLEMFLKCRAVVTPDFSNYTDMPKAQQLWNHYRRQWCGKYWQDRGVNIVHSLSWANGQIFDWTFAGIPKGAAVATSFVGDEIDKQTSIDELRQVLDIVEPCKVFIKANKQDAAELQSVIDFELIPPFTFRGK